MSWFNIWKWPSDLIDDIRQWLLVRDALKEVETIEALSTYKYELRKDNIGRLYTVINIPEELWPFEKKDQVWPWVIEQLRELDMLLMQRQLSDLLYPEVTKIEDAPAYLVVLTPSTESLSFSKFIKWIFNVILISFLIFLADRICLTFFDLSIINLIDSIF